MTDNVTVVVVAYNDAGTLEQCVRSHRAHAQAPIVIVDNSSDDHTWDVASMLASGVEGVSAVRAESNGGYASGGNIGRAHTDTEFLAVTNADCEATGDWLTPTVSYLEANPDVGAVSPTIALAGRDQINAEGLSIHKAGFGFNRHLGLPLTTAAVAASSVPGIQGTAFVVRTEALDAIGGWYEGGFLYHEDVELSWALRLAGYGIAHVPTPPIEHDYELTMSPEKFYLLERNRLEMLSADLGAAAKVLLAPLVLATEIAVWLYGVRKGSALREAKTRSYRSFRARRSLRDARRDQVRAFRRISDWQLLGALEWTWPRSQTATLHRDAPTSGRRGDREMPTS